MEIFKVESSWSKGSKARVSISKKIIISRIQELMIADIEATWSFLCEEFYYHLDLVTSPHRILGV